MIPNPREPSEQPPMPAPAWKPEPPINEPEPDRLPDEEPLPNPDENPNPPAYMPPASLDLHQGETGAAAPGDRS